MSTDPPAPTPADPDPQDRDPQGASATPGAGPPPGATESSRSAGSSGGSATADPSLAGRRPSRRAVASYTTNQEAERAVDWLSDEGFPVARVAIVGSGLRAVEQVTGRMTVGKAAGQGAVQGVVIGIFFALLFGLFFTGPGFLGLLVYSVILAALFGAVLGALGHAALGGTRDFSSISSVHADRYDLMVDEEVADEAERILSRKPGAR